jgi:hypothetical protein
MIQVIEVYKDSLETEEKDAKSFSNAANLSFKD